MSVFGFTHLPDGFGSRVARLITDELGEKGKALKPGPADVTPVDLRQSLSFKAGTHPLELLIIGVAKDMAVRDTFAASPAK